MIRLTRGTLALAVALGLSAFAAGSISAQIGPNAGDNALLGAPPHSSKSLVDAAIAAAKGNNKVVLVNFSASWCGWCHRFEKFLREPTVGKYMTDNFEIVLLTTLEDREKKALENEGSAELMKAMGGTGGIPFFFFLDASGKKLADANIMPDNSNVGHPDTPAEVAAFDVLLKKVAPRMTNPQRKEIHDYLTKVSASGGK